ncbi:MAG: hypothetical protein KGK33_07630, partial [Hyphomicrobiales bacterium]|nr:hypothetical protein [Hyphomicrobiales bacterium]
MSKKLALSDFRALRCKLEPHEFAISEGQDVPPSDLVEPNVWEGIIHLPEDVSIRISDHNGARLKLLYGLPNYTEGCPTPRNSLNFCDNMKTTTCLRPLFLDFCPHFRYSVRISLSEGRGLETHLDTERVRFLRAGFVTPLPGGPGIVPSGIKTGARGAPL